jgi:hypothetical protein
MEDSPSAQRKFGALEYWTVALFALTAVLLVFAWLPAVACLFISTCWTVQEKLIALLAPIAFALLGAVVIANWSGAADWILFPLVLTFSGIPQIGAAIYLYVCGRPEHRGAGRLAS